MKRRKTSGRGKTPPAIEELREGLARIAQVDRDCQAQRARLRGVGFLDLRIVALEKRILALEDAARVPTPADPGVTLNAEAAAAVDRENAIGMIADELVAALFRNGHWR